MNKKLHLIVYPIAFIIALLTIFGSFYLASVVYERLVDASGEITVYSLGGFFFVLLFSVIEKSVSEIVSLLLAKLNEALERGLHGKDKE